MGIGLQAAGAYIFHQTAGRYIDAVFSAMIAPVDYIQKQHAWLKSPEIIPSAAEIMDAWQRGIMPVNSAVYWLRTYGIETSTNTGPRHRRQRALLWERIRQASLELPPLELMLRLWSARGADPAMFERIARRYKLNPEWWKPLIPYLQDRPGVSDVIDLKARGWIGDIPYRELLQIAGADPKHWEKVLESRQETPAYSELREMRWRGVITPADYDEGMTRNGITDLKWRAGYEDLTRVIPPVSDLLHFDQKDVFVGPLASALHLYDEFPENAVPWAAKQGLTGGPAFPITVDGQAVPADWLHLYWGARWDAPAFGQIAEFYQRFGAHRQRPRIPEGLDVLRLSVGPGPGGLPGVPGGAPGRGAAAGQDVRTWLRYANIPPVIRDTFLAAAFRPLGMRQVSQAVRLGTIKRADAVESYQDQGYSPDDAERMADLAVEQDRYAKDAPRRSLVQRLLGESVHEIVASYETGVLSRALAAEKLFQLLRQQDAVDAQLGVVDNRILRGLADRALRSIRTDWMQGTLSPAELEAALLAAGIQPERVTYYVQLWTLERGHRRRAASSGQILSWVAKGLMPADEAARRLANLNWYGPDAAVLLADSQHKLAKLQAAEEARVSSNASKNAKAVAAMQRKTEALQKSLQSRLRASEPVSRLTKWLKAGIIDEPQFRRRMQQIGVVPSVIDQYVREVHAEMGTARTKAEEAATTKSRKGVRHAPVSTLRKWLKLGIINADQFRSMAAAVKTDKDDIERYVQQTEMGK